MKSVLSVLRLIAHWWHILYAFHRPIIFSFFYLWAKGGSIPIFLPFSVDSSPSFFLNYQTAACLPSLYLHFRFNCRKTSFFRHFSRKFLTLGAFYIPLSCFLFFKFYVIFFSMLLFSLLVVITVPCIFFFFFLGGNSVCI